MDSSASKNFELTAAVLHIIAMTLMLMDHLWATLLPAREWKSGISYLRFYGGGGVLPHQKL